MSAGEFGGMGLALGQVTGARSFNVDKLGRLTGISYAQVWTPGENAAECRKKAPLATASILSQIQQYIQPGYYDRSGTYSPYSSPFPQSVYDGIQIPRPMGASEAQSSEPVEQPPHNLETCSCGFYGYYDGSNDYHERGRVSAVVQGYGETVIGTRGFRAAKAKIVALKINKDVTTALARMIARNYSEIPLFDSFKRMVAEFPPDAGDSAITPETDADFWTRSI